MTGYKSKRAAALDEDGMYLVHQTAQPAAPEVWMFQHEETGSVTCIINDGINTPELFLEMNLRYALIGSPNSLKRPWVGIDWSEIPDEQFDNYHFGDGAKWAEQHLKEKNNG